MLTDAALVARRQEAMEAARMKMQEELDAKASIFREKQKQQEEEKRRQKIKIWDSMQQGKSYRGTATPSQVRVDLFIRLFPGGHIMKWI
ncbi:selenoprotein S [Notothenia coriiceps]|uniref:Selenoprotein S n=1 Tax=Notothenia coriiceps TaxID=8208 RepID=A0A6I9PBU8_9TELE|nr:PREDICTED: selenoprotein S [Notothenia coriiceps]